MKIIVIVLTLLFIPVHVIRAQTSNQPTPPITPRWAFNQFIWEDSVNTQSAALRLVDGYKEHHLPVGGIIIDSPWSTAYNNFEWDTNRYPHPQKMLNQLTDQHVKTILWLTGAVNLTSSDVPISKAPQYNYVEEHHYAINNGKPSKWWKGKGVHIDFTNDEAVKWWYSQLDKVFGKGIYGWKVDQAEVYFGDTVQTSRGKMPNEDFRPYYYNSMYHYTTSRKSEGIILGRPFSHQGGYEAAVDQLSLGWCGDFEGSWSGLKNQIYDIYKSVERGYGAPGTEVGGFYGASPGKEELIRYAQFGAMTATMINGGSNGAFTNHLPWYHDRETLQAYQKAAWLHTQLIPYLFSTVVDAHKKGGSLLKNVSYEEQSHQIGNYLFTKAIVSPGHNVKFHLPDKGNWVDFWTGKKYKEGSVVTKTYTLQHFPLFVKSGAIIPLNISNNYSPLGDSTLAGKQTILIYPDGQSAYVYHHPTGDGTNYRDVHLSYDEKEGQLNVDALESESYVFIFKGIQKPKQVSEADSWSYKKGDQMLKIQKKGKTFGVRLTY